MTECQRICAKPWRAATPIARRDFISRIDSAKQAETRTRRIEKACSMLVTGKRRPCCYSIVSFGLSTALAAKPKAKAQWSYLTSTERREFISWMDSAKQAEAHRRRIEQAARCLRLASDARDVSFLAEVRGDGSIDKICVPLGLLRFRGKKPKSGLV